MQSYRNKVDTKAISCGKRKIEKINQVQTIESFNKKNEFLKTNDMITIVSTDILVSNNISASYNSIIFINYYKDISVNTV